MIYFPHIPKSAGQTIAALFETEYGRKKCLMVYDRRGSGDVDPLEFKNVSVAQLRQVDVVLGHLPMPLFLSNPYAAELFGQNGVQIVSSVRDPIDRIVSEFNFATFNHKHPRHAEIASMKLIDYAYQVPPNLQTYYVAPDMSLSALLEYPNKSLFPISSAVSNIVQLLSEKLKRHVGMVPSVNQLAQWANGQPVALKSDLSDAELAEVAKMHYIDYELIDLVNAGLLSSTALMM